MCRGGGGDSDRVELRGMVGGWEDGREVRSGGEGRVHQKGCKMEGDGNAGGCRLGLGEKIEGMEDGRNVG